MTDQNFSPEEARAALDSAEDARLHLAAAANCPPWRHAAFGALMGLVIAAQGLPSPYTFAVLALALLGVTMIAASDRRRYGFFINGYRKGATRPLAFGLVAVILVLMGAELWLRAHEQSYLLRLGVALLGFAIGTGTSVWWNRVFRREMGVTA